MDAEQIQSPLTKITESEDCIKLENNSLQAVFSKKSGALLTFSHKRTDWSIQKRPELGRSFCLLVPTESRRDNHVFGIDQASPAMARDEDTVKFTWDKVTSDFGGELDIRFTGIVRITEDGLEFTAVIENASPLVVEAAYWPIVGDLSMAEGTREANWLYLTHGQHQIPIYPKFAGLAYYSTDYPTNMTSSSRSVPFGLLDCKGQGLYVGFHQTTDEQMVHFTFELKPGFGYTDSTMFGTWPDEAQLQGKPAHMEFSCIHFPFCQPGERFDLKPIVLEPYNGTWQYGADCYKRWRKTWMTDVKLPTWAQGVHNWQQYQINSAEDRMRMSYEDIVQLGEDCVRHGVKVLQITGWTSGGQDRDYPRHDTDPRLGTKKQFQAAIRKVQEMGVKVVLFTKYTWADQSSDWFNEELYKYASKDPYGHDHVISGYRYHTATQMADINTRRGIPMCFNSEEYRNIVLREYEKSFDLGADGMIYDEFHFHGRMSGDLFYCFSCEHGHKVPANLYAGDFPLAEEFVRIKAERNPEFLLAGEGVRELQFRYLTTSYFRVTRHHFPMQRYIAPEAQMVSGIIGIQDRTPINQCLMYRYMMCYEPLHFKGRLDDFTIPLEYGNKVDALRERYSDYLWDAEYRDQLGASVTANGKPLDSYTVFVNANTGKQAVVVCNHNTEHALEVSIETEKRIGSFLTATPEQPEATPGNGQFTLAPMSAVVFMEP